VLAGPDAVARPLALLDRISPDDPPVVSWSTVTAPALVVGRGVAASDINREWCAAHGVPVVQRRSGGGPVLWDHGLVSLDVVLPPGHPLAERDVTRAYAWLGEAIAHGLNTLGAPVAPVPLAAARRLQARSDLASLEAARACFGGVSPFEILGPGDRKCVGLAQVRRAAGTIFQCGIAMRLDTVGLSNALSGDPDDAGTLADALDERVVDLQTLVPGLGADAVIAAVDRTLTDATGARLVPAQLRPDELDAQARIAPTLEVFR
jgi:lipoate-protein ligase A